MALALLAAMELGISTEHLFERLPQYSPSALRGRTLRGRGVPILLTATMPIPHR